jgi:hypothetical protein
MRLGHGGEREKGDAGRDYAFHVGSSGVVKEAATRIALPLSPIGGPTDGPGAKEDVKKGDDLSSPQAVVALVWPLTKCGCQTSQIPLAAPPRVQTERRVSLQFCVGVAASVLAF